MLGGPQDQKISHLGDFWSTGLSLIGPKNAYATTFSSSPNFVQIWTPKGGVHFSSGRPLKNEHFDTSYKGVEGLHKKLAFFGTGLHSGTLYLRTV